MGDRWVIGGWHLSWMLSDHPNYPTPRGISSQPKPPSRCQSVGGTYCDRWVAPIVDAIRPPKLPNAPGKQQPTQTSKSMSIGAMSIGGWHLLRSVGGTYCGCHPTTQTTQSPGEAVANSNLQVDVNRCDVNRWVAPIVDAIRPPKLLKAPGRQ